MNNKSEYSIIDLGAHSNWKCVSTLEEVNEWLKEMIEEQKKSNSLKNK